MIHPDGLPTPRRYWAILAIALTIIVVVLDGTIANVALPTIAKDLNVDAATSIWIVNAYQIATIVILLPLASLGEVVGYRRVYLAGLVVFTLASLACMTANSWQMLSLARVLQGLGAAGIISVNIALVRFTYPARLMGRAVGINALVVAVASCIGPSVASAILSVGHWRWLFGVNIPIGLFAILVAWLSLPETARVQRRPNLVSAALNAATFGFGLAGLQAFAHGGGGAALAVPALAAGAFAGVLLIRHERGQAAPLIAFDLLRSPMFAISLATSLCSFMAQSIALVALPFELHNRGYDAVAIGLLMTPWPLATGIAAPIAGMLSDRYSPGALSAGGLFVFSGGLLALALTPADVSHFDIAWRMVVCGIGFGFFQAPNNRAIISAAPRSRAGSAGGLVSTTRIVGQSIGAAGVALVFNVASLQGAVLTLYIGSAIALLAALISCMRIVEGNVEASATHASLSAGRVQIEDDERKPEDQEKRS